MTNPTQPTSPARSTGVANKALLEQRFKKLWARCLVPGSESNVDATWTAVNTHYAESHRRYHNAQHLAKCIEQFDLVADQMAQPDYTELAIWFHDVIYEPGQPDNEARSAGLFCSLAGAAMNSDLVAAVVDLIQATTHKAVPRDPGNQMICDIDLSSFGFPWQTFLEDSAKLRAEFKGSVDDFCLGRRRFLEAMLQRPRIYMTDFFNVRYERQARENIGRFLASVEE